ncbi:ATP-dependent helicase [Vibrio astriarenae]|uniref:ATP-dependent helicase n=1 Tax=Vibrio astriarenae TaxID=1481923 RepID=UPI003734CFD8
MSKTFSLNEQQQHAVEYGIGDTPEQRPPLLVIAGAGTGKTNTLAHRSAQLLLSGVSADSILLMTFARRAATELALRAQQIVEQKLKKQAKGAARLQWIGTFHSVSAKLLREHAVSVGLEPDFTIMDRNDSADMLDVLRHELGLTNTEHRFPKKKTCLDIYSRCVNAQSPLSEVVGQHFPNCQDWVDELKSLFAAYAKSKADQACLDYDDLLLYCYHMARVPQIASKIREQFDYVLVDEYQDTNLLQAGILKALFPTGSGLTVVGDDAQSIYGFRAATVDNILDFPNQFETPAKVISLKQNYRSHQGILDLANTLLSESSEGFKVELVSDTKQGVKPTLVHVDDDLKQAEYIIERVLAAREEGTEMKRQAVLFRTGYHSDRLEVELTRRNIPFVKHGGLRFLEASHVKDLLAILRWTDNPKHKISAFRVMKLLSGVGPKIAANAFEHLAQHQFRFQSLEEFRIPQPAKANFMALVETLTQVHNDSIAWTQQVTAVAKIYQPMLELNYDDHFVRWGDVEQLMQLSQQFPNRERFLTELTLDPPQSSGDLSDNPKIDDDFLILSTVHSAKGQEWANVYVLNVADGNFPNEYAAGDPRALEEERRLLNVAITRAKHELHLIQPLRYWVPEQQRFGDKHVFGAKSRFLTDKVVACLDEVHYPKRGPNQGEINSANKAIADIRQSILRMWNN